jgi:hypothetical protein
MKNDYEKQYSNNLLMILRSQTEGTLVNLTLIYDSYGRPRNKSPRRVIRNKSCSELIRDEIMKVDYRVEEVIRFVGNHILANSIVAFIFLKSIDQKSYVRAMLRLDREDSRVDILRDKISKRPDDDDMYKDIML